MTTELRFTLIIVEDGMVLGDIGDETLDVGAVEFMASMRLQGDADVSRTFGYTLTSYAYQSMLAGHQATLGGSFEHMENILALEVLVDGTGKVNDIRLDAQTLQTGLRAFVNHKHGNESQPMLYKFNLTYGNSTGFPEGWSHASLVEWRMEPLSPSDIQSFNTWLHSDHRAGRITWVDKRTDGGYVSTLQSGQDFKNMLDGMVSTAGLPGMAWGNQFGETRFPQDCLFVYVCDHATGYTSLLARKRKDADKIERAMESRSQSMCSKVGEMLVESLKNLADQNFAYHSKEVYEMALLDTAFEHAVLQSSYLKYKSEHGNVDHFVLMLFRPVGAAPRATLFGLALPGDAYMPLTRPEFQHYADAILARLRGERPRLFE